MAGIQLQGASGSVVEAGAFAAKGIHTIAKPHDYGALGHYVFLGTTGTMAAGMAANGELVQMRWVDAIHFCLIHEVQVLEFRNVSPAFATGVFQFNVILSTAWTADGTGGSAVSVTDPQLQLRPTGMGPTLFSTGFRLATTAALGAGTKTFNTLPFGACFGNVGSAPAAGLYYIPMIVRPDSGGSTNGVTLWKADIASGEHPIVLSQNEGISIRGTVPGTGTWVASFLVKWSEVVAF
jgi:hypothetical protein